MPAPTKGDAGEQPRRWVSNWLMPAALVALVYGLYVRTLYPSVPGGDSGELLAESCNLGVAHPPGYPLFVLITKGWLVLTEAVGMGGSPAWRANLLSAGFDVGAAVLIYKSVLMLVGHRDRWAHWPAFAAAAMFAFSPLIWLYAVGAEVFSLNNLFVALLLHGTLKYASTKSQGWLIYGALLCGLALCNQHTAVLYIVPLVAWILWTYRARLSFILMVRLVCAGVIGLSPYVFLWYSDTYARSRGSWGDCSTLDGFLRHFLRKDYGTFKLYSRDSETAGLLERNFLYLRDFFVSEAPYGSALLSVIGVWVCWTKPFAAANSAQANEVDVETTTAGRAVLGAWTFYIFVFHFLSNMPLDDKLLFGVHARFWQQPNVIAFTLLGVGLSQALTYVRSKVVGGAKSRTERRAAARAGSAQKRVAQSGGTSGAALPSTATTENRQHHSFLITSTVCIALVAMQAGLSFTISDQSDNDYMGRYAKAMLEPLPEGAVFLSAYDMQWATGRYMQDCEGVRPDISLLNTAVLSFNWFPAQAHLYPNVTFPKGKYLAKVETQDYKFANAFSFGEFLDANVDSIPVFNAGAFVGATDKKPDGFEFDPWGIGTRVRRAGTPAPSLDNQEELAAFDSAWATARGFLPELPKPERFDNSTWESTVRMDVLDKQQAYAEFLLDIALSSTPPDVPKALRAAVMLEDCYANRLKDTASMFKNMGLAYARVIQSKLDIPQDAELPEWEAVAGVNEGKMSREEWNAAASVRVMEMWTKFIQHPDGKKDPAYQNILGVVQTLHAAASKKKK